MINVGNLERAISIFRDAQYDESTAQQREHRAKQAWLDALRASQAASRQRADAEAVVTREARVVSGLPPTNRDARRAQVMEGMTTGDRYLATGQLQSAEDRPSHAHVGGYADDFDDGDLPF